MINYLNTLKPYCTTPRQHEILDEVINTDGNMAEASRNLKGNRNLANETIRTIRKQASRQGWSPEHDMTNPVPDTHFVKGISTLYDDEGNVKLQWVKSSAEAESIAETLKAFADELGKNVKPVDTTYTPLAGNDNLLNMHVLTDFHLGMFAWKEMSDVDWSSEKAEKFLLTWFKYAIDNAPAAKYGLLLNLGDFFHSDSVAPVTPASGHLLDVDIKYAQMVRIGTRLIKQIVEMMRAKYEIVLMYNVAGNHDFSSTIWLKEFFYSYYESDPNVIVDVSPDIYHAYQHGDTSLFFHHGHKRGPKNIQETLVAKFRKIFGNTTKSYTHVGHYHHSEVKESNTMIVEQHRTMAAKDTYASEGGYLSGRSAFVITYHKEHGEINRLNVGAELIHSIME